MGVTITSSPMVNFVSTAIPGFVIGVAGTAAFITAKDLATKELEKLLRDKEKQREINTLALEANEKRYQAYCLEQEALKIMDEEVIYAQSGTEKSHSTSVYYYIGGEYNFNRIDFQ